MLTDARDARPNDSAVYMQLAGFYNRQGEFTKTMDALNARAKQEPTQPGGALHHRHLLLGKGVPRLHDARGRQGQVRPAGPHGTVDEAIKLNPDYFEALTYKNLLLRVQATLEKNPARQQALLKEANEFRDKAQEIQAKQRAAGAGE